MAPGGFVKKFLSLSSLATMAIVLGMVSWGSSLNAQNAPSATPGQSTQSPDANTPAQSPSQTPSTQQPPAPETPPASQQTPSSQTPSSQAPPSQTPDTAAPPSGSSAGSSASGSASTNANGSQTFTGTVMKQGDKYVLKDDTGKTYDIDHQTDVAKFEGKRVRVQGTLDPNGKIMVK
jgi:hypothetical protein